MTTQYFKDSLNRTYVVNSDEGAQGGVEGVVLTEISEAVYNTTKAAYDAAIETATAKMMAASNLAFNVAQAERLVALTAMSVATGIPLDTLKMLFGYVEPIVPDKDDGNNRRWQR